MKTVSLEKWDKEVAPHLQSIKTNAGWIQYYVRGILRACHAIAVRPEWETLAEDEINKTIQVLEEALSGLKRAQVIYRSKPHDGNGT